MAVRLGKINLPGAQNLYTEESRVLIEQRVPEQQGSVFQDMGREPVSLVLEGLLLGEQAFEQMEQLRQAQSKAEPLAFAADIVIGSELTDVVIESFEVRQVAGYANRIRFTMRLREHVEEPANQDAANAAVDDAAKEDAKDWEENTVEAADAVANPETVADKLAQKPELLDHMDMDDLGASVTNNMDKMDAGQLTNVVDSVAAIDPKKGAGLLAGVHKSGGTFGFVKKLLSGGASVFSKFKATISKICAFAEKTYKAVGGLSGLLEFYQHGMDSLAKLKKVGVDAGELWDELKDTVTDTDTDTDTFKTLPPLKKVVIALGQLVTSCADLIDDANFNKVVELVKTLGLKSIFDGLVKILSGALKNVIGFFRAIIPLDALLSLGGITFEMLHKLTTATNQSVEEVSVMDIFGENHLNDLMKEIERVMKDVLTMLNKAADNAENIVEFISETASTLGLGELHGLCTKLENFSQKINCIMKLEV